jgi:chromosome segregation ATPase
VPTSGELIRPSSASCDLSHASKGIFSTRGCIAATGRQPKTLREARSQKRKATSPTPQEEELDQEIKDLEAIHQQVQRKKEKMLRLANLQKKIDEAAEEMRHLTQDDQDRRPQRRELHQDNPYDDDEWYDDFHHGNFAFNDASPLSAEL